MSTKPTTTSELENFLNDRFCSVFCRKRELDKQKPSQRLLELTEEERYKALHDLHGVPDELHETPDMVDRCFEEMQICLERMELRIERKNNGCCSYYRKAMNMSESYVRGLYKIFLRAKYFNPREAAEQMERFFEMKHKLFGEEKLVKHIKLSDLPPEDIECWNTGFFQVLPENDVAGRKVLFFVGKMVQTIPIDITIRLFFMAVMEVLLDDEEVQKRGMVMIYYGLDQSTFNSEMPFQVAAARETLPYRSAGNHFAYNNPYLKQFLPLVEVAMAVIEQCKFRTHFGSHIEVQYDLMAFGMPKNCFPVTPHGTLDMAVFRKSAAPFETTESLTTEHAGGAKLPHAVLKGVDKAGENTTTLATAILEDDSCLPESFVPGPNDIIIGYMGKKAPGNLKLRGILEDYRHRYDMATDKMEKMVVTHHVFSVIREMGGKFVDQREDNKRWEEVSDEKARRKIALGFRNLRRGRRSGRDAGNGTGTACDSESGGGDVIGTCDDGRKRYKTS